MISIGTIEKVHNTYLRDLNEVKQALIKEILSLPDNPKIERISSNCFTINSSNLSNDLCLSPEYYDFKLQYRLLAEIIEDNAVERVSKLFDEIVRKGSAHYPTTSREYHRFHPQVVSTLKSLMR